MTCGTRVWTIMAMEKKNGKLAPTAKRGGRIQAEQLNSGENLTKARSLPGQFELIANGSYAQENVTCFLFNTLHWKQHQRKLWNHFLNEIFTSHLNTEKNKFREDKWRHLYFCPWTNARRKLLHLVQELLFRHSIICFVFYSWNFEVKTRIAFCFNSYLV